MIRQYRAAILFLVFSCVASLFAGIKEDVLTVTGNRHTKIVWSRQTDGNAGTFGIGHKYRLLRFDTDVGTEAFVFPDTAEYFRAKMTWDGARIMYNKGPDLYVVNFDGTNNHLVSTNMGLGCAWYDETSGKQYAVVTVGNGCLTDYSNPSNVPIYKVNIADPTDRILVYTGQCSQAWLAISRDGKKLGGSFPWSPSTNGIYDIASKTLKSFNQYGCWAATPPDNSYRFMIYPDDSHRAWRTFNADGSNVRDIWLAGPPWIDSFSTYHARFAVNDPTIITLDGPHDSGCKGCHNTTNGSPHAEITVERVDTGLTTITAWARVTYNANDADFFASAWVDQGIIGGTPGIGLGRDSLNFTAVKGGVNPDSQSISVSNIGGGTLNAITVSSSATWLTLHKAGSGNGQTISNIVMLGTLDTGKYQATVTVSGGGASNTATYQVKLLVGLAARQLNSITVSPDTSIIAPNDSARVMALIADQYGNPFASTLNWTVSGGGTVNPAQTPSATSSSCVFISNGTEGTYTVTATSGAKNGKAYVIVTKNAVPSVSIVSPGAGDSVYQVGDTLVVRWTASTVVTGVGIDLSLDSGMTFGSLISGQAVNRTDARWGNFKWKITDSLVMRSGPKQSTISKGAQVMVMRYSDETVNGVSRIFRIKSRATSVASPAVRSAVPALSIYTVKDCLWLDWNGLGGGVVRIFDLGGHSRGTAKVDAAHPKAVFTDLQQGTYVVMESIGTRSFSHHIAIGQ
jgi:hypothetical protein